MRKLLASATTAAVMAATLSTPAWAADPAPTDVQISWAGDQIRVTWADDGAANTIRTTVPADGGSAVLGGRVEGETNELMVSPSMLGADREQVQITVASGTTGHWGAPTASVTFDTRRPAPLFIQDADLLADRSVRLRWTQATRADQTPNDPLDRPTSEDWRLVWVDQWAGSRRLATYPIAPDTTTMTVPAQAEPWTSTSVQTGNVWGRSVSGPLEDSRTVHTGTQRAGISVPAQGVFGERLGIYSTLDANHPVQLQARPTSTAPWKTVGRYSGSVGRPFETGIASLGGRQYRLWVPAVKEIEEGWIDLFSAASTSAKSSQTTTKFAVVGFDKKAAELGTNVYLTVKIQPGVTVRGNLQRWANGSWRSGPVVQIKNGAMVRMPIKTALKGETRYRVVLPKFSYNGLPILATTSKTFTLIVL
ncbi:hypothetical protein ACFTSF_05280 [Kribbella sp. NPDC056951]|uniref:hypothetical protein n=1 Tax=Kribbella sp. NPDC056951 TaxID=3345978 RepID=UPI003639F2BF